MWEEGGTAGGLARALAAHLQEAKEGSGAGLAGWLQANRTTFALADMVKVRCYSMGETPCEEGTSADERCVVSCCHAGAVGARGAGAGAHAVAAGTGTGAECGARGGQGPAAGAGAGGAGGERAGGSGRAKGRGDGRGGGGGGRQTGCGQR